MTELSDEAIALIESDSVATMATANADGSVHLSEAWVGLEDGEIVVATLSDQRKLRNIRRDPRVAISIPSPRVNEWGLKEYLVVEGTARITEGGAAQKLQELAHTYLGPDVVFPRMPNPPAGYITRIRVEQVRGVGPWKRDG
jgi:PPOX class probable F420-dependent enzyme